MLDNRKFKVPDYLPGLRGRSFPYHVDTTADHWWPKGLQRLWPDHEGYVSCITSTGKLDRRRPPKGSKGFAQKRGGHKMTFGISPWNNTFEPEFDEVDKNGPPLLKRMVEQRLGKDKELRALLAEPNTIDTLVKLCFSLLIRSPAFRDRYSHAGKFFGREYDEETGKGNMSLFWRHAKGIDLTGCNSGKLLLLHSDGTEFFFGDGLYDTIFTRPVNWRHRGAQLVADLAGDALVPLLPDLCAYLYFQGGGLGTTAHLVQVSEGHVAEVNELTQIYSKERLFFRASRPTLTQEYKLNEHRAVSQGSLPLIKMLRAWPG